MKRKRKTLEKEKSQKKEAIVETNVVIKSLENPIHELTVIIDAMCDVLKYKEIKAAKKSRID